MRRKQERQELAWHRRVLRRCVGESGASFVEYALLAGLVAVGVAVAVSAFGDQLFSLFKAGEATTGEVTTGANNAKDAMTDPGSYTE